MKCWLRNVCGNGYLVYIDIKLFCAVFNFFFFRCNVFVRSNSYCYTCGVSGTNVIKTDSGCVYFMILCVGYILCGII